MKTINESQLGRVGKAGEDAAVSYLEKCGYEIEGRNLCFGRCELDVICSDRKYVIFCEVKSRTRHEGLSGRYGSAGAAVNKAKRDNLKKAARAFLKTYGKRRFPRFDVIEVYFEKGGDTNATEIRHLVNAF